MTMPRSSPTWCALASTRCSSRAWRCASVASPRLPTVCRRVCRRAATNKRSAAVIATENTRKTNVYCEKTGSKRCPSRRNRLPTRLPTKEERIVNLLPFFLLLLRGSEEKKGRKRNKPANAERGCCRARRSAPRLGNLRVSSATTTARSRRCGLSSSTTGSACLAVAAQSSIGWRHGATACGNSHRRKRGR